MNSLVRRSKLFLGRNGGTILTCVGAVGVVATAVMSVQATPKAVRLLAEATEEKGEKLTKTEVVLTAAPVYIPSIVVGASTIACIFGANVLNKRHQAALMSAYALLDSTYKDYRNKVQELYGEEANDKIKDELAKDKYEEGVYPLEDNKILFYDEYSQQYFESTMEKVLRAEYILNRDLSYHSYVCLNEFYDLLGLPRTEYGDILGWHAEYLVESQWYSWVEFNHRKTIIDDDLECYILEILTEPIPDFDDF